MKEYIRQGLGFTFGMFLAIEAIGAFNKMFGAGNGKVEVKKEDKPVEEKEMA